MIKKYLKNIRYKKALKRYFAPSQEFMDKNKVIFLETLKAKIPASNLQIEGLHKNKRMQYAYIYAIAVFFLAAGSVAYADKADVSPTHPLYELKRVSEKIQLSALPKVKEAELHEKFAKRRVDEIKEVKNKIKEADSEEKINKLQSRGKLNELQNDFIQETEAIGDDIPAQEVKKGKTQELCKIGIEAVDDDQDLNKQPNWMKFRRFCDKILEKEEDGIIKENKERGSFLDKNSKIREKVGIKPI